MHRLALVLAASFVPTTSAWALCDGLAGQAQLDCVNNRLEDAAGLIMTLQTQLETTQADLAVAQADLSDAEARLAAVEADTTTWTDAADTVASWSTYLSVDTGNDEVVFSGANVYVNSGAGSTGTTVNGTGNLIVGYDEGTGDKSGSHNLVVGAEHSYSSYGGLVGGYDNSLVGAYGSVVGGQGNMVTGEYSSVLGGRSGTVDGDNASIAGGFGNISGGTYSVAVGGFENQVHESDSVVVGGTYNVVVDGASGYSNVLVGGYDSIMDGGLFYSVMSYGSNDTMTSSGYFN